jgi:hypothetical protein
VVRTRSIVERVIAPSTAGQLALDRARDALDAEMDRDCPEQHDHAREDPRHEEALRRRHLAGGGHRPRLPPGRFASPATRHADVTSSFAAARSQKRR